MATNFESDVVKLYIWYFFLATISAEYLFSVNWKHKIFHNDLIVDFVITKSNFIKKTFPCLKISSINNESDAVLYFQPCEFYIYFANC